MGSVTANTGSVSVGDDMSSSHEGSNGRNAPVNVVATPGPSKHWPSETDIIYPLGTNKIMLTVQRPLMKAIFQDTFERIHVAMVLQNSFPNAYETVEMITDSLITAAKSNEQATNIHNCLVIDGDYATAMTHLVRTRTSNIMSLTFFSAVCSYSSLPCRDEGLLCGNYSGQVHGHSFFVHGHPSCQETVVQLQLHFPEVR